MTREEVERMILLSAIERSKEYVDSLKRNADRAYGDWLDSAQSLENMRQQVERMK